MRRNARDAPSGDQCTVVPPGTSVVLYCYSEGTPVGFWIAFITFNQDVNDAL